MGDIGQETSVDLASHLLSSALKYSNKNFHNVMEGVAGWAGTKVPSLSGKFGQVLAAYSSDFALGLTHQLAKSGIENAVYGLTSYAGLKHDDKELQQFKSLNSGFLSILGDAGMSGVWMGFIGPTRFIRGGRSTKLFSEIRSIIFKQNINVSSIRELARTDPWKSYWGIYKPNVFKPPLNDEQKALLLFSQMYENAYSHPECPNNKVINDDDMFDGWIIHQRKKREEQLKESNLQQVDELHKHGDAQEIMLMAKSKDDVSKIQDMNHPVSRAAVRSRQKVIKQKGTATDLDFPDVKQDVAILKAQAAKQVRSRKG